MKRADLIEFLSKTGSASREWRAFGTRGSTYIVLHDDGRISVRLWNTDIVFFNPDGSVTLACGKWRTVTTRSRMNKFLPHPWRVYTDKGEMLLYRFDTNGGEPARYHFRDGITICSDLETCDGEPYNPGVALEIRKKRGAVRKYAKAYVKAMASGKAQISDGDCLICRMFGSSDDCIASHVEEGYYVGSLMVNALRFYGESKIGPLVLQWIYDKLTGVETGAWGNEVCPTYAERIMVKFLYHMLGI